MRVTEYLYTKTASYNAEIPKSEWNRIQRNEYHVASRNVISGAMVPAHQRYLEGANCCVASLSFSWNLQHTHTERPRQRVSGVSANTTKRQNQLSLRQRPKSWHVCSMSLFPTNINEISSFMWFRYPKTEAPYLSWNIPFKMLFKAHVENVTPSVHENALIKKLFTIAATENVIDG